MSSIWDIFYFLRKNQHGHTRWRSRFAHFWVYSLTRIDYNYTLTIRWFTFHEFVEAEQRESYWQTYTNYITKTHPLYTTSKRWREIGVRLATPWVRCQRSSEVADNRPVGSPLHCTTGKIHSEWTAPSSACLRPILNSLYSKATPQYPKAVPLNCKLQMYVNTYPLKKSVLKYKHCPMHTQDFTLTELKTTTFPDSFVLLSVSVLNILPFQRDGLVFTSRVRPGALCIRWTKRMGGAKWAVRWRYAD